MRAAGFGSNVYFSDMYLRRTILARKTRTNPHDWLVRSFSYYSFNPPLRIAEALEIAHSFRPTAGLLSPMADRSAYDPKNKLFRYLEFPGLELMLQNKPMPAPTYGCSK